MNNKEERNIPTNKSIYTIFCEFTLYKTELSMRQMLPCVANLMDLREIHTRKTEGIVNIIGEKREPISRPAISEIGSYFPNRNPD